MPNSSSRVRIGLEGARAAAVSRRLWNGLMRYNREAAGPVRYVRKVISARDGRGRLIGGAIVQCYWLETYLELLWLAEDDRRRGTGAKLLKAAENFARTRGSRVIHLNTFSFQAPGFYEKQGYRRFGAVSGSPKGCVRYYYVKRLIDRD